MQKKIIALAVAGLASSVAYAQTNVTIWGIADAAYTYSSQGDNKFSGIESGGRNGSRIGFRGEEALGNGLKAVFLYEFGNNIDVSSGIGSTRLSYVGLSGKFGSFTLGKQAAPSYLFLGRTNANDVTSVHPTNLMYDNTGGWAFTSMTTGGSARWDNSIAWSSPDWSGFNVRAIYSFGEQVRDSWGDASSDASQFGLGASYANGPLYLTAIYQGRLDNDGDEPSYAGGVKVGEWQYNLGGSDSFAIGGNYDFKVVKLFANYLYEKWDNGTATTSDSKHSLWSLGLGIPVSQAGTINMEYMQFKAKELHDGKARGFGIGYEHKMSPRTIIYSAVSFIKNGDDMYWGHSKARNSAIPAPTAANPNARTATTVVDENSTNFQVGIRHAF